MNYLRRYRRTVGEQADRQAVVNTTPLLVASIGVILLASLAWAAIGSKSRLVQPKVVQPSVAPAVSTIPFVPPAPLRLILVPPPIGSNSELDKQITRYQADLRQPGQRPAARLAALDTLGWLFVADARATYDPGFYKLAEQCALEMEIEQPDSAEALLLRGHVLHQFHRFKEAEILARKLVATRASASDYGLLGDTLMEQGRLDDASNAYQTMLNLRPGFESYVRAAHFRWLKGELSGARELMSKALGMVDPHDVSTVAWAEQRVALYDLQAGDLPAAQGDAETALQAKPNDAAAQLALGRILSAEGRETEALDHFRAAAKANALPDFLWQLADHLEAQGLTTEAAPIEKTLRQTGRRADPRTYALYLATARQDPGTALQLSEAELNNRADVLTWDALAWSQFASGQVAPAAESMKRALAEGTQDGRLFLHAAVIASATNDAEAKQVFLKKTGALRQMLLPSEQRLLDGLATPGERQVGR